METQKKKEEIPVDQKYIKLAFREEILTFTRIAIGGDPTILAAAQIASAPLLSFVSLHNQLCLGLFSFLIHPGNVAVTTNQAVVFAKQNKLAFAVWLSPEAFKMVRSLLHVICCV